MAMYTVQSDRCAGPEDIRELTEALASAFAEGIDLGPRGAQIRDLGQALEARINALRLVLVALGDQIPFDVELLNLDQLTYMAETAQTYGTD